MSTPCLGPTSQLPVQTCSEPRPHDRDRQPAPLPKELRPLIDLRIDTSRLLDREVIVADRQFNAERHLKRLLVRPDEHPSGDVVWIRVYRPFGTCFLECVDPAAHDLERCGHTFVQLDKFQNSVGFLEELAAPSFSGRKAMTLIWNLMAIGRINEALLHDGSMLLPSSSQKAACCDTGAPTYLRPLGAFTDGKSWYEKQGAIARVSQSALRSALEGFEDDLVFGEKTEDPRLPLLKDFDRMVFERCALYASEMQASRRAYLCACQFLNSLPTRAFDASLSFYRSGTPL
jgi:hypothetical protein